MSFEMPEGELKNYFLEVRASTNTHPVNAEQKHLTENLITPFIKGVIDVITEFRKRADEEFKTLWSNYRKEHAVSQLNEPVSISNKDPFNYPVGFCQEIRDIIMSLISFDRAFVKTSAPGIQSIHEFCEQGGIFKGISGILRNAYFQNAIQMGDYFIDPANDACDTSKPPIHHCRLDESGFENIINFEDYAHVMEVYWDRRVYPNIYFPNLAPFFPIISIDLNGELTIQEANMPVAMNVLSGCERAREFITKSQYSQCRLPPEYLALISPYYSASKGPIDHRMFQHDGATEEELNQAFQFYQNFLGKGNPAFLSFLGTATKIGQDFNNFHFKPETHIIGQLKKDGLVPTIDEK